VTSPRDHEPGRVRDADLSRPAAWRWIAFVFLVVLVISLWVPVLHVRPARPGMGFLEEHPLPLLLVFTALAALVLPASVLVRILVAALLVGTTFAAWALEEPIRRLLGPPWVH